MAKFTLTNVRLFAGGADLTTNSNKAEISVEQEEKDATAFSATGGTWHESLAGLHTSVISGSGQWDAANNANGPLLPDDASFAFIGTQQAVTICPSTAADNAVAYMGGYLRGDYSIGGTVGDVTPWNGKWTGSGSVGRGQIGASPIARTVTGTGAVVNLIGGVPAFNTLIGTLHVISLSGTTPAVSGIVQSSAVVGMTSPTTRLTFTSMNSPSGQVQRLYTTTPITDAFYRLSYTITGTTPSIVFTSAVGIG